MFPLELQFLKRIGRLIVDKKKIRPVIDSRQGRTLFRSRQGRALLGDFVPEDIHTYRIDRHTFTVYLSGDPSHPGVEKTAMTQSEPGVDYMMADRFELNLGILSGIDPNRPILVNMSSCGGDWDEGMKIFGAILACPNPITVLATKWARSMTSIIPLAADRFVIRPPAQYMYHYGTFAFLGLVQELKTHFVELEKSNELMLRIYIERLREQGMYSKKSKNEIRSLLKLNIKEHIDVWLTARQAVRWGFADAVFDGNHQNLRATKKNFRRRERMLSALRKAINVEVVVS